MPTMGNETLAVEEGAPGETPLVDFFCRRFGAGFFFIILLPALV
jgi:hypothetical protein